MEKLVYGRKTARVGTSPKSLARHHERISSSEEIHGARKDRGTSEGLDTHVLQRTSPTDKSLVEKKACYERKRRRSWPKARQKAQWMLPKPPQEKVCLNKCPKSPRKPQRPTRRARKRQRERKSPNLTSLTFRITGFPRKRRKKWTICSVWQEL
ncbi:hypothetical protein O181_105874 [Austropuccinia psidii MF-1]|uniref:Uncharacterized protein n=1 Tax=Austropuccinia psidii MF-1 TaxID=1389203 RepID=A0A9Q3JQ88_9BASI|nr:hypothetical protein [Austropuccinia psidii MF-1]